MNEKWFVRLDNYYMSAVVYLPSGGPAPVEFPPTPPAFVPLVIIILCIAVIPPIAFCIDLRCCTRSHTRKLAETSTDAEQAARQILASSKQASQRVRIFVSGGLAAYGMCFFIIGFGSGLLSGARLWPDPNRIVVNGTLYLNENIPIAWIDFLGFIGLGPGMMLLALVPSDHARIRITSRVMFGIFVIFSFFMLFLLLFSRFTDPSYSSADVVLRSRIMYGVMTTWTVSVTLLLYPAVRCGSKAKPTRWVLGRLWLTFRLLMLMMGLCTVFLFATSHTIILLMMHAFISFFVVFFGLAFGMRPSVRRIVQRRLGDLGTRGEARSAAAVAALVGSRDASTAFSIGIKSFRGLPYGALSDKDFTNSVDSGLHSKTLVATMGSVDAFVSHSWHDPSGPKWKQLSRWAEGRAPQPLLWLDKACIDQQRIDESLAALPVYLAGCKELLVLIGPTYTSRLWCVMELFVFLQMGSDSERVVVLQLEMSEGSEEVSGQIERFDALQAMCFKPDERQRLLGIIETAFGDFSVFNAAVRSVLTAKVVGGEHGGEMAPQSRSKGKAKYQVGPE